MKILTKNKVNIILLAIVLIIVAGGFFTYQKLFGSKFQPEQTLEEVDLPFDPEGPYALLFPRRDGNALILNIKRTASYDGITYELAYQSEGIDRGVMGTIDTKQKKGEYEQEILFGTCSKNVCKYDKDVENGTLTLHIKNGSKAYKMVIQWHLQKPDVALGVLTSGDSHLIYKLEKNADPSLIKYSIVNDLSGVPKLPDQKVVLGKVYAVNTPEAKTLPPGEVTVELVDNPPAGSKISRYDEGQNRWVENVTRIEGSKLRTSVEQGGIFAVLTPQK